MRTISRPPTHRGGGVALAIRRALARASLEPESIDAVHLHGTATPFNDAMECAALDQVFSDATRKPVIYGTKGAIGHTLGAAGAIESVASFALMKCGELAPTLTNDPIDPRCHFDLVRERRIARVRYTLKLSSAFGGANCALVLAANDDARGPSRTGSST